MATSAIMIGPLTINGEANCKHFPIEWRCNSCNFRRQLLAGENGGSRYPDQLHKEVEPQRSP